MKYFIFVSQLLLSACMASAAPCGTSGAIQFNNSGACGADAANLFFDNTNKRVGLDTAKPDQILQVSTGPAVAKSGAHIGPLFMGSAYAVSGVGGGNDGLLSLDDSKSVSGGYALYLADGGQTILNSPSGTQLQLRVGGSDYVNIFENSGTGNLCINCNGSLVSNGIFNAVGGNGAIEWDENGITEFFVKNTSQGNSAGSLVAIEGYNSDTGSQPEGWLFLGGHMATNLNAPHAPDTAELYGRNGVSVRLSTQENHPIDFWTNATFRAIITSTGAFAVGTNSPDASALLQIESSTLGSLPAPRMTSTQRDAIPSPTDGLLIYNTTDHEYDFYDAGTSAWSTL